MNTESDLYDETNRATYCPEDNKIRLYVGRVPRDEYLALRKDGWKATPKQDCDFVATWATAREDTALDYAGYIGDEDQDPEDRAADRAERFAGYRDKRTSEAHGHADTFDAGPSVHGYQNQQKADRAVNLHNRHRTHALTQWDKAEYWQTRTAGVIDHALHLSRPDVRRGRILKLEAEQRKHIKTWTDHTKEQQHQFDVYNGIAGNQKLIVSRSWVWYLERYEIEPLGEDGKYTLEQMRQSTAIVMADPYSDDGKRLICGSLDPMAYAKGWLKNNPERPADFVADGRWYNHNVLRIAYENQMLENEGGKASDVEMIPGGFLGKYQIHRVHKSNATKMVVSVSVMAPSGRFEYSWQAGRNPEDHLQKVNIQRAGESVYRAPTAEELEAFAGIKKGLQAKTKKHNAGNPKLINPTNEAAEALQAELNQIAHEKTKHHITPAPPSTVRYMTQLHYSANSGGDRAAFETRFLREGPTLDTYYSHHRAKEMPIVCKVRTGSSNGDGGGGYSTYGAYSVIVITDKPQKPLPSWTVTEQIAEDAEACVSLGCLNALMKPNEPINLAEHKELTR